MELTQRVWDYCVRQGLLAPRDRVVVAVSGGPDSLCLLDALHRLAPIHGLTLTVAHLNHGLRAAASDEAAFVQAEAAARALPCLVESVDTRAFASAEGVGLEAAARRLRYDFLARAAQAAGAARIAVAHTADDQAETVLMHLLRGSGLAGLRGMLPCVEIGAELAASGEPAPGAPSPIVIIRPLLGTTRAEVEAYCAERALNPRQDLTNQDTRYLRNWVRHAALPLLETRNPNLRATVARTAEVLAGEHTLAQAAVDAAWEQAAPIAWQTPGQVVFDRDTWRKLDLPLLRGLLRNGVAKLRGMVRDVDFAPLDAAARYSRSAEPGRSCDVPGGLRLSILPDRVVLAEPAAVASAHPGPRLNASGQLSGGWRFDINRLEAGQWSWDDVVAAETWVVFVDAARVTIPLTLRLRRPGERFQPLGLGGHSAKLSDAMVNAKVPAEQRASWPVVACGDGVVWLAGLRLDERFRVRLDTAAVLRLSFRREDEDRP